MRSSHLLLAAREWHFLEHYAHLAVGRSAQLSGAMHWGCLKRRGMLGCAAGDAACSGSHPAAPGRGCVAEHAMGCAHSLGLPVRLVQPPRAVAGHATARAEGLQSSQAHQVDPQLPAIPHLLVSFLPHCSPESNWTSVTLQTSFMHGWQGLSGDVLLLGSVLW